MKTSLHRWFSHYALPAMLAAACGGTFAASENRQPAPLVIALDYVMPERAVSQKFRTPETIDAALAEALAHRLQRPLAVVPGDTERSDSHASRRASGLRLTTLGTAESAPPAQVAIPIRYAAAPMAIMRTDTTIKRWEHLKGRTVCVTQGGNHIDTLAARYGAIEKRYPAPADALVALRIGECDAAVHDSALLEELIRLPEWKKFSARLAPREERTLALLVPARDTQAIAALKKIAQEWNAQALPAALMKTAVRNIAFEVYLEQDVPDCH